MSQSFVQLYVHTVYSTKGRVPFLRDPNVRRELFDYLPEVMRNLDSPVLTCGGTEDHVHCLVLASKKHPIYRLIGESKRVTSLWIKERFGMSDFSWQSGYGAFSVSYSMVDRVRQYIAGQERHHEKVSFQDELREFLRRNGIEYDERHIWE